MQLPLIAKVILNRTFFQKVSAWIIIIIILYALRSFMVLFLGTFLLAYLFFHSAKAIKHLVDATLQKSLPKKVAESWQKVFSLRSIVVLLYIVFIGALVFVMSSLLPQLARELTGITTDIPFIQEEATKISTTIEEVTDINNTLSEKVSNLFSERNYDRLLQVFKGVKDAGGVVLQFLISVILSFVFILDHKKLLTYLNTLKLGNFAFLYNEVEIVMTKITKGFGPIFKAQAMIAVINTLITMAGYYIIGYFFDGFPYVLTLGLIVFLASFIPVLGMWLSAIPITIVAYNIGDMQAAILVLIMIFGTSALEAYYLNPKIVSGYMEVPVSLTFLILIISEQTFGLAGLLIGMPLFYIVTDIAKDLDTYVTQINGIRNEIRKGKSPRRWRKTAEKN